MSGITQALKAISSKTDDIFGIDLDGIEVLFRLPSTKEASQYKKLLMLAENESLKSVIYEYAFRYLAIDDSIANSNGNLPAGIPQTVVELSLMLSGLDENSTEYTEELFRTYREQLDGTEEFMKRTICSVFSGYTFKTLDEINYQELVKIFIHAEKILKERGIIESEHTFTSPEKAKPKPFRVEDVIRQDGQAHTEFERPEDPETAARIREVREMAIKRAKDQELEFSRRRIKS